MDLDYVALKWWLDVAQLLGTLALGLFVWVTNRDQVRAATLQRLERDTDTRLDALGERLTRVEAQIEHLPQKEDIVRLHERVDEVRQQLADVNSSISGQTEAVHGLERTVSLLLEQQVDRRGR